MKTAVTSLLLALAFASGTPEQATTVTALADPRVDAFLDVLNLTHYAAHFANHEVDYETLLGLTDAELEKVGVQALGARKRILVRTVVTDDNKPVAAASPLPCPPASQTSYELPMPGNAFMPALKTYMPLCTMVDVDGDGLVDASCSFACQAGTDAISGMAGGPVTSCNCIYINNGQGWSQGQGGCNKVS